MSKTMSFKVFKSGIINNKPWAIITTYINNKLYHQYAQPIKFLHEGNEYDLSPEMMKHIKWQESGSKKTSNLINKKTYVFKNTPDSRRGYSFSSTFRFGMYKDYQIGMVYALDIGYIEWCIFNIEGFFIIDIEELQSLGVFRKSHKYEPHRNYRFPEHLALLKVFKTIQELDKVFPFLNSDVKISEEALTLNNIRREENYTLNC